MMKTLDELRQEPHWSYSSLNTYLHVCSLQWYFRYVERAETECTSVCFPFGRAFHAALTAQAWEKLRGGSRSREELTECFSEVFKAESQAAPKLLYKEGENYDSTLELASRMLDAALANWPETFTVKSVSQAFKVRVPGLSKPLIGEYDMVGLDGRDCCIVDWKSSASRWPAGKADRDLQATVFSYAYSRERDEHPLFRFDVITKTKKPSCESHYTSRGFHDFRRFEVLAQQTENAVSKGVFLPNETSFACNECPYRDRCRQWPRTSGSECRGGFARLDRKMRWR